MSIDHLKSLRWQIVQQWWSNYIEGSVDIDGAHPTDEQYK